MSVKIIDTLKPKNNGLFPIVEAVDVAVAADMRLPEALAAKADASALASTDALVATKANASDVATATAELQGEIDQIVISASSEAVVAPEVAAARVDDNGVPPTFEDAVHGITDEDVENINANIFGGIGTIQISYTSGYYVNNVAKNLSPFAGFNYSEIIELKKGETIVVIGAKSSTTTVVDLLSHWSADGTTYVDSIEAYETTETTSTEYTATADVEYIRVCSIPIPTVKKNISGIYTDIDDIEAQVEGIAENSLYYESDDLEATEVDGYFINNNGVIVAIASNYVYTQSIELRRGDSITIESSDPSGSNISRISLWTASGTYIRTVDYGTTTRTTATYKATEKIEFVRLSYVKNSAAIKYNTLIVPPTFEDAVNGIIDERISPTNVIEYSIAMFESVAFCGDSYVKGQIYNSSGLVGDRPRLAWGSCMGRLFGVESHIYASSGADTNTWQSRQDCMPLALSDNPRGLYILCLGINDSTYVTTGTIEDITSYESYEDYPNTFYGNYGKIIEQIMAHAPNSKIIIMTPYHPSYNARYVTPISEITEHYGIAMIDTTESELCTSATYTTRMVGGHPTAALHSAIAKDAENMISKCIADNYDYFKDYAGM